MFKKIISKGMVIVLTMSLCIVDSSCYIFAKEKNYGIQNPRVNIFKREIVTFGNYWQDDTNGDGVADKNDEKTPIKWQVLTENDDELFLFSDVVLDKQAYNNVITQSGSGQERYACTWENCSLRKWLNNDFLEDAFSENERNSIKISTVSNYNNPTYNTSGGNNTKDKIFELSYEEMTSYGFNRDGKYYDDARVAKESKFATKGENGYYWLRTPGEVNYNAMIAAGTISSVGAYLKEDGSFDNSVKGVRPAIRVNRKYVRSEGMKNISVRGTEWDRIEFGNYNGNILKWRVLRVNNDDAFLISDIIVDKIPYNEEKIECTWAESSLRKWLNNNFYSNAFSAEEKSMIKNSYVENKDNVDYDIWGGEDTNDNIFLLSGYEIKDEKYGFAFYSNCYTDTRIAYDESGNACYWWLRTPGKPANCTLAVFKTGWIQSTGQSVTAGSGVRPVLHIDLDSEYWEKINSVSVGDITGAEVVESDIDKVVKLESMIGNLNDIENVELSDKEDINDCYTLYEELTDEQKKQISREAVEKLMKLTIAIKYLEEISTLERTIENNDNLLSTTQESIGQLNKTIEELNKTITELDADKNILKTKLEVLEKRIKETEDKKLSDSGSVKNVKVSDVIADNVSKAKYKVLSLGKENAMGTVEFMEPLNKKVSKYVIPTTITSRGVTYEVIAVGNGAFKNSKKLKTVTISEGIKAIGKETFLGCKKLKKIIIKSTALKKVGKNSLKGIHKKCVVKVVSEKYKKIKKLLKKKGQGKKVKIKKI